MTNKILVYMDQEDLDNWKKVDDVYNLFLLDKKHGPDLTKERNAYYAYIVNKYGILRNKQIYMDPLKGYIYDLMR